MTERAGSKKQVSEREARKTALVVAGVLACIAAWSFYRGRPALVAVLSAVALALVFAGVFMPRAARWFHVFWMRVAVTLGHINSRVLLTLMYYLVFTPYGFVSRLVGRDPLRRRGDAEPGASHWVARKNTRQSKEQFERLF